MISTSKIFFTTIKTVTCFACRQFSGSSPLCVSRLEECYFLQNIYLGVEVADDAVAAVNINTEYPWVVKSLSQKVWNMLQV